jgi:hypothetical protein
VALNEQVGVLVVAVQDDPVVAVFLLDLKGGMVIHALG